MHDPQGRRDGGLGYKSLCLWVIFEQEYLHTREVWRGSYLLIDRGHLGIRTPSYHKLHHFLGVNCVLSALNVQRTTYGFILVLVFLENSVSDVYMHG